MSGEVSTSENNNPSPPPQVVETSRGGGRRRLGRADGETVAVYLIQNTSTGSVKVGHAVDVDKRLNGLQSGHEHRLEIIGEIDHWGRPEEAFLHDLLREHNIRGEWFADTGIARRAFSAINERAGSALEAASTAEWLRKAVEDDRFDVLDRRKRLVIRLGRTAYPVLDDHAGGFGLSTAAVASMIVVEALRDPALLARVFEPLTSGPAW